MVVLGTLATKEGRVAVKTTLLIPEILPNAPVRPLSRLTSEPTREDVEFPFDSGVGQGYLVRPQGKGPYGAAILFLGINPDLEEPTFLRLVNGLARVGIVVMIPISQNLYEGRMATDDIDLLVGAFKYVQKQEFVSPDRVGYTGFSVGASLAIVAAQDERINQEVAFLNAFGGYYDAFDLLRAIATRTVVYNGQREPWEPSDFTVTFFVRQLINNVRDPRDQEILNKLFLKGNEEAKKELDRLSPLGMVVYRLLTTHDPTEVEELIKELPPGISDFLSHISPKEGISRLKARTFIMHDRGDAFIPYTESRRLSDALSSPPKKLYTEFAIFEHMLPRNPLEPLSFLREVAKLYAHLYRVMREVA